MEFIFLVTLIVFQVLDILTTQKILKLGGYESNPVMKWLMDKVGVNGSLFGSKLAFIGLCITVVILAGKTSMWVLFPLNVFYVGIIINKVKVINKLKK